MGKSEEKASEEKHNIKPLYGILFSFQDSHALHVSVQVSKA